MKIILAVFLLTLFFSVIPLALAKDDSSQNKSLAAGEVVNGDYFAAGNVVEIAGTVEGDAYIAGGQILVTGTVKGDLLSAGGSISVSGKIDGDIRAIGGQLTLSGEVGKNVTLSGGAIHLTSSALIHGNVLAIGGSVQVEAPISGSITAGSGSLMISSNIGRDIDATVGELTVTSRATVGGNVVYLSDNDASISPGAKISGTVTKRTPSPEQPESSLGRVLGFLWWMVSTLLVGLVLIKFLPRFSFRVTDSIRERPWASLGVGFATLFLTPIAIFILLITVIGIPIALITTALYFVSVYMSLVLFTIWIGRTLEDRFNFKLGDYGTLFVGVLAFFLLTLIPILGALVAFFGLMAGLGAIFLSLKQAYSRR